MASGLVPITQRTSFLLFSISIPIIILGFYTKAISRLCNLKNDFNHSFIQHKLILSVRFTSPDSEIIFSAKQSIRDSLKSRDII